MSKLKTIGQFIIEEQSHFPDASGELSSLLNDITIAAKIVNSQVNKAGLVNILGDDGTTNVHGESVKKLDVFANEQFINALSSGGQCCVIASEECEDIIPINNQQSKGAKYVVLIDPLDGSSNIDVNITIGTIFSIYTRITDGVCSRMDCLQKGVKQVASGYIIYGTSTMIVYTTGQGVNGFTLYPSIGEFCLSHPKMKIPVDGNIYSINEGNYIKFPTSVKKFIKWCQEEDKETSRPLSSRYIGSMVGDLHRTLIKGGIFIYPSGTGYPSGKLRLMYECNPFAFIIEQAGGKATDGNGNRIMEIQATDIHQRTPIFIGSPKMVDIAESFN
jgi:fructose-1,6-bisphosphatase I